MKSLFCITLTILFCREVQAQDGVFDIQFGEAGSLITNISGYDEYSKDMDIDQYGNIFIAGYDYLFQEGDRPVVAKHLPDGEQDPAFGNSGVAEILIEMDDVSCYAHAIDVDMDGSIYLGGTLIQYIHHYAILLKLLPNGILDATFGDNGMVILDSAVYADAYVSDVIAMPDGNIYWCGTSQLITPSYEGACLIAGKCSKNGTINTAFADNGLFKSSFGSDITIGQKLLIQPDGKILLSATTANTFGFVRLFNTGQVDPNFGNTGTAIVDFGDPALLRDIGILSNGNIVSCGYVELDYTGACEYGQTKIAVAMLNASGQPDMQFDDDGWLTARFNTCNDEAYCLLVQPDNQILIGAGGGNFSALNPHHYQVIRYTPTGQRDNSFGENGIATAEFNEYYNYPHTLAFQPSGMAIMSGRSSNYYYGRLTFYTTRISTGVNPDDLLQDNTVQVTQNMVWTFDNTLFTQLPDEYPFAATIYNMSGQSLGKFEINDTGASVSLNGLPPAIYVINLVGQYTRYVKTVVVTPDK